MPRQMSSIANTTVLARKYRPRNFEQMVGQEHVVRALSNALASGRLHHAYLFTGTRGIGKTTVSRILAKSLNCTGPDGQGGVTAQPCGQCSACREIDSDRFIDYIELDAASNRSIDEIRDLIERAAYKPAVGRYKVFMIDEAHQLTKDAFNALLKTLEEPPEYLKFVLATTDPEKMLPTVLSRCLQFNLRPMAPEVVREHLALVLQAEGVAADAGSLRLLSRAARGSMRDALSLTDQAIAYGGGRLEEAQVHAMLGSVDTSHAEQLVQAIADRDGPALLSAIDVLRTLGLSAAGTLEAMAMLLQQTAIEQAVPGALGEDALEADAARRLAPQLAPDETQLAYSMLLQGRAELALMNDEYAALTMVLLRPFAFPPGPAGAPARAAAPAREPRPQPLRTPSPPAIAVAIAAPVATRAAQGAASAETGHSVLGERWQGVVAQLDATGAISGLVRELAWQAALAAIDEQASPPRWRLLVESDSLRTDALRERLQAAVQPLAGPVTLELQAGIATDTPARRETAARELRQSQAERTIRDDPAVQELLGQFKGARIVPHSIKPLTPSSHPEGLPS